MVEFPISGVESLWWLPLAVAFVVSAVASTAGSSGAFLILPFQVSVLGFVSPAVTPTNLLFNIIAIPGGVYRFYREKRMVWSLVWTITLGTVPGLVLGVFIRIRYLPEPGAFKFFMGLVLLYVATRLIYDVAHKIKNQKTVKNRHQGFEVVPREFSLRRIVYDFEGERYRTSTPIIFLFSALVGMIGGIYGIGGGAILAPFLVTVFGLPVYAVAGAALCGTFLNSTLGVLFYIFLAPALGSQSAIMPDWHLGLMFGLGGLFGIYVGARIQKYLPARLIKLILGLIMLAISTRYILGYIL